MTATLKEAQKYFNAAVEAYNRGELPELYDEEQRSVLVRHWNQAYQSAFIPPPTASRIFPPVALPPELEKMAEQAANYAVIMWCADHGVSLKRKH